MVAAIMAAARVGVKRPVMAAVGRTVGGAMPPRMAQVSDQQPVQPRLAPVSRSMPAALSSPPFQVRAFGAAAPKAAGLSEQQRDAQAALNQALHAMAESARDEKASREVKGEARAAVLKALSQYTTVMQDAQGQLPSAVSAQVVAALAQLEDAAQGVPVTRAQSAALLARLKDSVSTGAVAFGVISYWRGIWFMWDSLVFPEDPLASGIASAAVGLGVLLGARAFDVALAPPLTKMRPTGRGDQGGLASEKNLSRLAEVVTRSVQQRAAQPAEASSKPRR